MSTFDKVSGEYKDKSLVQKSAAGKLLELLKIKDGEAVIDIACGPGNITAQIKVMTSGRVMGVDISSGMINQALRSHPGIEFRQSSVEDMGYKNEFDAAFCNSALQWFSKPDKAMEAVYHCLNKNGRLGLACPATSNWASFFQNIVSKVKGMADINPVFSHWKNPWFHLPQKADYNVFFTRHGFNTQYLEIIHEENIFTTDEAFNVYLSGAANGFTGKQYYDIDVSDEYVDRFNALVKEEMLKEAKDGRVKVDFNRLYYVGEAT
jgi:ubiquinone/menaquinone biosynthesis C-methylase UbiE